MTLFHPFNSSPSSRNSGAWFFAGESSVYPDIADLNDMSPRDLVPCRQSEARRPGCKVFYVSKIDGSRAVEVNAENEDGEDSESAMDLGEQVLVFQYRGKFHAVDHKCPHSSYPLSRGTVFDIEDFGIRLSAGIRCPKHDWSFDLFRGNGDRGNYRLKIWEVELRPCSKESKDGLTPEKEAEQNRIREDRRRIEEEEHEEIAKEIWVRRKQRMG